MQYGLAGIVHCEDFCHCVRVCVCVFLSKRKKEESFNPECDENMCIAEATPVAVFVWVMMQPAAADAWGWRCVQRGR